MCRRLTSFPTCGRPNSAPSVSWFTTVDRGRFSAGRQRTGVSRVDDEKSPSVVCALNQHHKKKSRQHCVISKRGVDSPPRHSRMPSTVDSINYEVSGWTWINWTIHCRLSLCNQLTPNWNRVQRDDLLPLISLALKSRPNSSSDLSNCVIKTSFTFRMTMSSRLRNFFFYFIAADNNKENKVKHCCCCFGDNIIDNDNRVGRETIIIYASCGWAITKPFAVAIACGRRTYSIE